MATQTTRSQIDDDATARTIGAGVRLANPPPGEEVVIAGVAGHFPDCDDMYEFRDKLYNKVDLVSGDARRWNVNHPEIPRRTGKINNVSKFDAGFFGVHYKQAHSMDPMARLLLERAYEAIADAGVSPVEVRGQRVGVFVGTCASESEKTWFYDKLVSKGHGITGCARSMQANRISYWLGLKGPSFTVDSACSSSLYAFEYAYKAIRNGECDAALVGGTSLCLHPYVSLQFNRLGVLSPDGICKCFDADANGYARSETIAMVFLQKAKNAKRVYAKVVHAKTNCDGFKEKGITYPSGEMQQQLLREFYEECRVDPSSLSYLEAHGTGTKVGDPEEMNSLDDVFCANRATPLPVGSVKSNLGHTEPASGLCSISKIVLSMECGYILPNVHFKTPRPEIQSLINGRMKVVTEPMKMDDEDLGLVGLNSFGFGGANCHVLLQRNLKTKIKKGLPNDGMKRLVCVSGRTEDAVTAILEDLKGRSLDAEFVGLLHNVFSREIPGHRHRGYSILSKSGEETRSARNFDGAERPIWFVLGSTTTEWFHKDATLFELEAFSNAIDKVDAVLEAKLIKLRPILLSSSSVTIDDKIINALALLATQIGILEVLHSIGIYPDKVIGYGYGETLCGYIDGSLTLEQTVLTVYYMELASVKAQNRYHSAVLLKNFLKDLIPTPKTRFNKWLSTSIPAASWDSELARSASVDYFVNGFLESSVQEEDVARCIPRRAVLLEIGADAPAATKRLPFDVSTIGMMGKKVDVNVDNLLVNIGQLYELGLNPHLDKLYPKINYPVSRSTPMISPLIKWNYSEDWFVTKYRAQEKTKNGERKVILSVTDEEWTFLSGHVIDGRNLFPATGYLQLIWETLAIMTGQMVENMPVVFENVRFNRATNVPEKGQLKLICMVQKGSGNFEVIEGGAAIVTGRVYEPRGIDKELTDLPLPAGAESKHALPLQERDIYKELRLRGYNYSGFFRGVVRCDSNAERGFLKWNDNWITYIDTMLQMQILSADTRNLYVPTSIQLLSIDPKRHIRYVQEFGEEDYVPVYVHGSANIIRSGGIEVRGLNASSIARRKPLGEPVLERYKFVPNKWDHQHPEGLSVAQSIRICMQFALENLYELKVRAVELVDEETKDPEQVLAPLVAQVLGDQPVIQADVVIFAKTPLNVPNISVESKSLVAETNCSVVIGSNLLGRPQVLKDALGALKEGGFILSREHGGTDISTDLEVLLVHRLSNDETIVFLRKTVDWKVGTVVDVTQQPVDWLPVLQNAVKNATTTKVYLVAQQQQLNGILGLFNCLRREPGGTNIRCVFLQDNTAPRFDITSNFFKSQLTKDIAVNVYKNGAWGTYRHLMLEEANKVETEHGYVNVTVRGDLSSLKWIEGPLKSTSIMEPEKMLVHIYYSAINFRDVMTASGKLSADVISKDRLVQECIQGFEFSGRTASGKRVMGMVTSGALSTLLAADSHLLWDIPEEWTLEEAATVPVVYGTVLYALFMIGSLRRGSSILIHAGSGGVGQAAINVALHYGCTVFTTVGTQEKRDFIKKQFPHITDEQIGNSRDTTFEQMVMRETDGRGVDFVLNSLAEEKLQASVRCLAPGGKFLEIGKFDLSNNNPLGLEHFAKEVSFHGVMLDALFVAEPSIKKTLSNLLMDGVKTGAVKPLVRTVFKDDEIEQAFRYMAAGKHIGKVLINVRPEEPYIRALPQRKLRQSVPRYSCSAERSYVIAGGLGGFGLELADWLILRGARQLVFNSRKGVTNGYQSMRIRTWRAYGATVHVSRADITTKDGCVQLCEEANDMAPIEGIFNLAVVLKDALFENQTVDNFHDSFGPKAVATVHLDEVSRVLCPQLRDFVVFSSVSCGRGNAGQTNYGMSNSIMERICEKRRLEGFPALAIEWGAIGEVGLVADMQEQHTEIEIGGTLQQRLSSCLAVMDNFLRQSEPIVSSMVVAEKRSGAGGAGNIVDAVANILGLRNLKTISFHSTLAELGMDSMMAVEIKQTLEREFEVFLTAQDIRSMTFAKLTDIATQTEDHKPEALPTTMEELPQGMQLLFRNIGDEETSSIPLIPMKTATVDATHLATTNSVYIIPGIEGVSTVMEPLCQSLRTNAFCLQLGYDLQPNSLEEMANNLYTNMHGDDTDDFALVGYSFGAAVAVWLAAVLESTGKKGTVVLIDGAPDMLLALTRHNLRTADEAEFQTSLLCTIMATYMPNDAIHKCKDKILGCASYDERVAIAMANTPKDIPHSKKYQKAVCDGLYKRLQALMDYKAPPKKLASPVVLFKPTLVTIANFEEDYGLRNVADKVEVRYVDGNHHTILENPATARGINEILGVDSFQVKHSMLGTDVFISSSRTIQEI